MINPFKEINWSPGKAEIRKFGLTVLIGFIVISGVLLLLHHAGLRDIPAAARIAKWLVGGGFLVFCLSWLSPTAGRPLYMVWFFVAACVGTVISNFILIVFFYLVFTPIGLLVGLSGRDPLKKRAPASGNWEEYKTIHDLKRYYRQY